MRMSQSEKDERRKARAYGQSALRHLLTGNARLAGMQTIQAIGHARKALEWAALNGSASQVSPERKRPGEAMTDKPLAADGLTSYRYRGTFEWIMIGAKDDADALREAGRSTDAPITPERLQVWDATRTAYRDVSEAYTIRLEPAHGSGIG